MSTTARTWWVWRRAVGGGAAPDVVLRRLAARTRRLGQPPPAALVGDWFGGGAVLAPSVRVAAVPGDAAAVFAVPERQPVVLDAPAGSVGGGWLGYFGYGLTDPVPRRRQLPLAAWGWADHVLHRDPEGRWWFEALLRADAPAPLALADELARLVATPPGCPNVAFGSPSGANVRFGAGGRASGPADPAGSAGPAGSADPGWRCGPLSAPAPECHAEAVRRCQAAIADGEVYQANVCIRLSAGFAGDPAALFAAGTARLAPVRAAYLAGSWGAVVSLSPELFLARHGARAVSSPIKGTLPRRGPGDEGYAAALRGSAKDVAENIMIVDMVRNDLGRVSVAGGVAVRELLAVRPAPGVWHLVSTVAARLLPGTSDADLLTATFPPASVTGAPKLRTLELLGELEPDPREVYCGAVGMASPVAGTELNVAIRTVEITGGTAWIGVGGGITVDSDPASEWQECWDKAGPLLALLAPP